MNRLLVVVVLGAAIGAVPACSDGPKAAAPNREQARVVEPAAKEFIDSFRAATWKITDLSCHVEQTMADDKTTTKKTGDVVLGLERVSNGAAMVKKYRISVDGEDGATVWAFDGHTSAKADAAKKEFQSLDTPGGDAIPPAEAGALVPNWVLRDLLIDPKASLVAAKMLPDETFGGVRCRVVEYTVELPMVSPLGPDAKGADDPGKLVLRQLRRVGAEDLLTRKLESWTSYTAANGLPPRTFVGVYSKLHANTKPEATAFALEQPKGYATAEADPAELGFPGHGPMKLKVVAGDPAPAFALKTPEGKEVTLASLKGRVVLLDFWATWCGPCKLAMPKIQALHEKYQGKAVSVFGVDTWEKGAADIAQKYMTQQKYTYGLLLNGDELAKAYAVPGIPTLVLIGPDGKVLFTSVGMGEDGEKKLVELIDGALGSK